jgi:exopolyphosphatase / guanosine-5'-triphosphate,3'-diphosphate pyrophosphatase
MRHAVIDIGTNSVKLLVAEVTGGAVVPIREQSEQTRLGQGFYPDHQLQPDPVAKTAQAVANFRARALDAGASSVRVIATSAARDAVNPAPLLEAVRTASGLEVEIISGEQEADWVYAGVRSDPALAHGGLLIVDVGGGSTEFILGQGTRQDFRGSFPLGTVRLSERIRPADPPLASDWAACRSWVDEFLAREVAPELQPQLERLGQAPPLLVGTGGTTSILAAMELGLTAFDRTRIEQTHLSRDRMWHFQKLLWGLPLAARRSIPGLPPSRADVILFGVAVFVLVMEQWGFQQVRVSTRGLRFGALMGG